VLALAAAAAGCGGGGGKSGGGGSAKPLSKSDYAARVRKDGQDISNVFKPLSQPPSSLKQLADSIKKGEDKLRSVADDLDSVTPPKEVAADNDALVAGLRKLADELEPIRQGAAENNVKKVQKAVNEIQTTHALEDAQKATADMKKKGYDIGELGR
jgi:soluble cytochrome b562